MGILTEYIDEAIKYAEYRKIDERNWFAEIKGFEGVWASCDNIEACRQELIEVLEEWIIIKIRDNDNIPVINGIDLNVKEATYV